ncbi:MAG: YitT family protein [Bacillota bacterium]|nr:YitT family protein [Bacillota bacterium]
MESKKVNIMNFYNEYLPYLKRSAIVLLSSLIYSISLNMFIIPHKFLSGGVSGIALIFQYATGFNAGYTIIILNIPLFVLSYLILNKEFTFLTIIGIVGQSVFIVATKDISRFFYPTDPLLSGIYGGVINGFAVGSIFKNHGSSGGTDVISMIFRKKANINIGKASFSINLVIVSVGSVFFGVEKGLYTLIAMYITSAVVDQVIKGFNKKNLVIIITNKEEAVVDRITHDLRRSATVMRGKGAYSQMDKTVIYCVVATSQIPRIKQFVERSDPGAFMSILDASQVLGKGFDHPI